MPRTLRIFFLLVALSIAAALVALPEKLPVHFSLAGKTVDFTLKKPEIDVTFAGKRFRNNLTLKQGLDIQGGMQVVLKADMSEISEADRQTALESAREIIARRVDLYGVTEPVIQTIRSGDEYRLQVELAGLKNGSEALQLIGQTAHLDFRLQASSSPQATTSAVAFLNQFQTTDLTGRELKRATVQFNQQTNEPEIGLEFSSKGQQIFAQLTRDHVGSVLGIFIDDFPVALPRINTPILDGRAVMTGGFTVDEAKQLAIQLNAGALPVPITVLEQRSVGASLGQDSVQKSVVAGTAGIGLVVLFMIAIYGFQGLLATLALGLYALLTVATYKILGVTLSLPGIAGLLLSIGMAVDSNILIFERMKEELRSGREFRQAMEAGFGRAWDSIKDANVATIMTALILINPFNFPFFNTSGMVRGFGITLLIGVCISLFTGIVVTRTLMRLFLKGGEA